jgi:hypothetical protein
MKIKRPHGLTLAVPFALLASILVAAPPAGAQTAPEASSAAGDSHLFHIVLLLADNEDGGAVQGLPKGIQAAVADISKLLPYKSYRVVDTSVVRASQHARVIVKGPNGEDYAASFRFRAAADAAAARGSLLVDEFSLTRLPKPSPNAKPLGPGIAPLPMDSPLTASFRIGAGETVVVGTSRLEGANRALIVLFTAVN